MSEKVNNSYRSILKATGVFGMMQVIKMIISIVTSKFVAVYLGPIGIGLVSLLNNAINIILAVTNFEFLRTSTREIALQNDVNDKAKLNSIIATLQKMAIVIGVFGALLSVLLSKTLSYYTFGTYDKQSWFLLLSVYFLVCSYSNSRLSILQGINNIKLLAWSNVLIAFFTALGSVILYYFLRIEGVIWVLLYSSFVSLFFTIYFTKQYSFNFSSFNVKEFIANSSPIFKLGFYMSLNLIFGQITFFIIKLYLNDSGSSTQVLGYYEVNSVILINYVGLIFNAMSYDFYPKLTAISKDNNKVKSLVNNQIEIAIIFVTPAIIFLYLAAPFFIELLYSKAFLNSFMILKMSLFSVILKAVIFPLGYIVLVKGNKKLFFKQALLSDVLNLILSLVLHHFYGLTGLGLAFILNYFFYGIYIYFVVKQEYDFKFMMHSKKLIAINIFLGLLSLFAVFNFTNYYSNLFLVLLFIISLLYSYNELNKRVDIKGFINEKINKLKK